LRIDTGVTAEPVGGGKAGQAVDALLDGSVNAGRPSAAVFLSAPLDDSVGERDEGTADEEFPAASGGAVTMNGAAAVNGTAYHGGAAPADGVPALDDIAVAAEVSAAAAALEDDSVAAEVAIAAQAATVSESCVADGDLDDEVIPAPETGDGNLSAAGEPSDGGTRRTDVTETLAANALLPEVVLAPEAFTAQARAASAAWDAAEVVTEIYTGHYNQLVRLAVLLVHDLQTAEEVVQDAFEAMHLAWRRLRDSEKALSYLRQTVVNRSRSVLRHRKVVDMHAPKPAPDEPSAEHAALALLERSAVAEALRSLPLRQREAIVLRYYADFSEADIAAAMGISRGAVKSHTARAMAALKSILEQETS
jgi:RNA polymerase sigma-70 factor (sigma-E family)